MNFSVTKYRAGNHTNGTCISADEAFSTIFHMTPIDLTQLKGKDEDMKSSPALFATF